MGESVQALAVRLGHRLPIEGRRRETGCPLGRWRASSTPWLAKPSAGAGGAEPLLVQRAGWHSPENERRRDRAAGARPKDALRAARAGERPGTCARAHALAGC